MTNTVKLKRSGTLNSAPSAGQLEYGELAINYNNGNLYYKNTSNVVTVIASNQAISVTGNVAAGNIVITGGINASGQFGNLGQVLTANGANGATWTSQFYSGNLPPQAQSISPNYGDIWYYIGDDGSTTLYMWVTDGTSDYFYDFLPPAF